MKKLLLAPLLALGCAHNALPPLPEPTPDLSGTDPALARVLELRVAANNLRDWQTWERLHTEDCLRLAPELEAPLLGRAAMREAIARLGRAVPNYHLALVRVVGQGPWVAAELRASGTFEAPLEVPGLPIAIPPTGNSFRQHWVAMVRFQGERIAEIREYYDQEDLLRQLKGGSPWPANEAALTSR
ncbi:MAG: ester cyclase [Myxococcota bacterium]